MSEWDRNESAGYLANHMARLFANGLRTRIQPLGLETGQFAALLALWERDGLTQAELVAELGVEQATMANTLARMERDGLVRRRPHKRDGRVRQVWLTSKAKRAKEPAQNAATAQNARALADLTDAERSVFIDLMRRVIAAMNEPEEADGGLSQERPDG